MVPFERATVVSYRLSIVTIAAAIWRRMSPTLKSTGVGHFWAKFVEERIDRCKPNFNTISDRHGAVVYKCNRVDIFCCLSTMHERDRQTDRQIDHGTVTCGIRLNRLSLI